MVRSVFKQRWWWSPTEINQYPTFENNNFIWTQWRRDQLVEELPTIRDQVFKLKNPRTKQQEEETKQRERIVTQLLEDIAACQEHKAKLMVLIKEAQDEVERINTERKQEKKAKKIEAADKPVKKKKTKKKKKAEDDEREQEKQEHLTSIREKHEEIREIDKKVKESEARVREER